MKLQDITAAKHNKNIIKTKNEKDVDSFNS